MPANISTCNLHETIGYFAWIYALSSYPHAYNFFLWEKSIINSNFNESLFQLRLYSFLCYFQLFLTFSSSNIDLILNMRVNCIYKIVLFKLAIFWWYINFFLKNKINFFKFFIDIIQIQCDSSLLEYRIINTFIYNI